jgi:hypothetical protein
LTIARRCKLHVASGMLLVPAVGATTGLGGRSKLSRRELRIGMSLHLQRCFAQSLGVGALFWQAASGTNSAAIWVLITTLDEYGVQPQAEYWRRILAQDPATTFDLASELAAAGAYRPALHWAAQAQTLGHPAAVSLCSSIKQRLSPSAR